MKHPHDNKTVDLVDTAAKRGRKPMPSAEDVPDNFAIEVAQQMSESATVMTLIDEQQHQQTQALAHQLGYEGRLDIGALEDEIRFYQRRTVEASMELGKRLLLLKDMTPHGEFKQRVELLGFSTRMAQKFMGATLKFSKSASKAVLTAAGTQTKLLELLVLDDDEVDLLANGDSIGSVSLDTIQSMSVSELRLALRDRDQQLAAKDKVLAERNSKVDQLEEERHRPFKPKRGGIAKTDEQEIHLNELNAAFTAAHLAALRVATIVNEVFEEYSEVEPLAGHARACIDHVVKALAGLAGTHNINVDLTIEAAVVPPWLVTQLGKSAVTEIEQYANGINRKN